ncbi:MAG: 2-oxo acid dehydrogenase subunit E2 [Candidatus Eremiobacteraeota bacterium]|nr:dihydrolipoamide acetyltransferase family protein [Candidatus Eremiobacteraeota bacterium]NNM93813.1 2-oxo acid dehydrogenase subunit E2 [Candidatus Eremiobacteraeota bacterium]
MATTITMPQLGETVTEGTVAQWLKKPGDSVEKYEAFVEVSTDKVNAEVPSPVTGTLREVLVKEGETVATGTPIAVIDEVGAATQSNAHGTEPTQQVADAAAAPPKPSNGSTAHVPAAAAPAPARPAELDIAGLEAALRVASPAVRKLAREHRIDIRALQGSGANGRVTAQDVLTAAQMGPAAAVGQAIAVGTNFGATGAPAKPPTHAAPASGGTSTYGEPIPGTTIPLNQARRIIAQRMVESKHTAPHAWSMVEVDVTNLWKWRQREKDKFDHETGGLKLTMLPFFIRAVVESLAAFPLMNARFTDEGIYVNKEVNIGIAIGLATNLVVPVVKHADQLSIKGLAVASAQLIDKARRNKLGVDDLAGGTFTVNNNGSNGSIASAPIINGGQAGIVTMEAMVKRPVVTADDAIAIRSIMNVCLSLDHRVVDGYVASGFLADLKRRLEAMGPTGIL